MNKPFYKLVFWTCHIKLIKLTPIKHRYNKNEVSHYDQEVIYDLKPLEALQLIKIGFSDIKIQVNQLPTQLNNTTELLKELNNEH